MSAAAGAAALGAAAGGVICLVLAVVFARSWEQGLRIALDLWTAAGLLRLTGDPGVTGIATAAAVVAVRQIVSAGLRHGAAGGLPARHGPDEPS